MFNKILIANRGEIACRIIKTCQRLGIQSVAVFSDADRDALHVQMADEAVSIGPAPASESYLDIGKLITACQASGAEAVHPGYGFLSENAEFADALAEAGLIFIGPGTAAIQAMGDKIESKKVAQAAGVSTVPGHPDAIANADEALAVALDIGFPVMIKASAGGGGKGMRIAWGEGEVEEGFQLARSEARSSFGDDRIFIEKFVEQPRHIEIQVLADRHGNAIHLGERECSIQRRNQKVIEEAPSSFLDAETRASMGAQAVALAQAVGYQSAGTVEFIVDANKNFYFLEMNTRLQVEHPVTELVTGLDLVEEMIHIAAGEKLRIGQGDIALNGWAIECRVYAEDPQRGFLPSTGRLTHYQPPEEVTVSSNGSGSAGGLGDGAITVRNDTGVYEGAEISVYYDPMIAKLCTHAAGQGPAAREAAIAAMATALDEFVIDGIRHNVGFLSALMDHPRWQSGDISTAFIDEEFPDGFSAASISKSDERALLLVAAAAQFVERVRLDRLSGRLSPHPGAHRSDWVLGLDGEMFDLAIGVEKLDSELELNVTVADGSASQVTSLWKPGQRVWRGEIDGEPVAAQIVKSGHAIKVSRRGHVRKACLYRPQVADLAALMPVRAEEDTSKYLLCPMPGLVVSLAVDVGEPVKAGDALATIEAMKMENILRAERDGVVEAIHVAPGDSLAVDARILSFAKDDEM